MCMCVYVILGIGAVLMITTLLVVFGHFVGHWRQQHPRPMPVLPVAPRANVIDEKIVGQGWRAGERRWMNTNKAAILEKLDETTRA
jgi:hypothetical protein